ncbi:MAG: S8 family serine peptidase, partial [Acidobacteriota bacterium]|nr:S8 family serine peptidase [Acidobacteriota bacterium]
MRTLKTTLFFLFVALIALLLVDAPSEKDTSTISTQSLIVQGSQAAEQVRAVGGEITHELGIINAVVADLTPSQRARLQSSNPTQRIYENQAVESAGKPDKGGSTDSGGPDKDSPVDTIFPTQVGADLLHSEGITGSGVTIAVVDSGHWPFKDLDVDTTGAMRLLEAHVSTGQKGKNAWEDHNGHGTHVASIAVSSGVNSDGKFNGVAPDANLIMVKAFDKDGMGSYASVIDGLDYILANKDTH